MTYLKCNTPDDLQEKNKNRRKIIKRKIKNRTQNQLKDLFNQKLNEYETNESSKSNQQNNDINNLNIDESVSILPNNFEIILSDLSNAIIEKEVSEDELYQIREYRAAENILGIRYTCRSESWAIGCLLWEIITDKSIFKPTKNKTKIDKDREQLALMEKYLGKINKDITMDCPRSWELYEDDNKIIKNNNVIRVELEDHLKNNRDDFNSDEIQELTTFLKKTWYYNHLKRLNPEELLKDHF